MIRVGIYGGSGYTGLELMRILLRHPGVQVTGLTSRKFKGQPLSDTYPLFEGLTDIRFIDASPEELAGMADVIFMATPHGEAMAVAPAFVAAGKKVIDLSADFRFADAAVFAAVYGQAHPRPELLRQSVYGLAEWHTEQIRKADIIANPGCYPTATLLPLLPLARAGLVDGSVVVNAISGISGAGKKERLDLLYGERTENAGAYNPGRTHRHAPEIEGELRAERASLSLLFTPHLAPIKRGMCVTTVVRPAKDVPA